MNGGFQTLDGGFTHRPQVGFSVLGTLAPYAWYDASQETAYSDGNAVSSVTDWSGNANHCVQATAANQPLYKTAIQNSLPIFRFDGVDDFVRASFGLLQPCYRFIVFKLVAVNAAAQSHVADGEVNDQTTLYFNANESSPLRTYAGGVAQVSAAFGTATFERVGVVYNGASSKAVKGTSSISTINPGTVGMNGALLGAAHNASAPAQVDIGEVIIGSGALSDDVINDAMTYLKDKWGVT